MFNRKLTEAFQYLVLVFSVSTLPFFSGDSLSVFLQGYFLTPPKFNLRSWLHVRFLIIQVISITNLGSKMKGLSAVDLIGTVFCGLFLN